MKTTSGDARLRNRAGTCVGLATLTLLVLIPGLRMCGAAAVQKRYYAHEAVEDEYGVIAPWYRGQNGQLDMRIRVAAETLRRYPWLDASRGEARVPEYLLSSFWRIGEDGTITTPPLTDWMNGDRGQLASYVLYLMPEYYRYLGDPVGIAHAKLEADLFLRYALTPPDHAWPRFPISVPVKGKPYGQCDPRGYMQLDLAGRAGYGLLRVYQLTGIAAYFDAVKHWADVLVEKRDRTPGAPPWGRYANFDEIDIRWKNNCMTGGVIWLLCMFDELIRLGYTGRDNGLIEARDAARAYLRDVLLPAWTVSDTWGRQYWDWECPVQVPNVSASVACYLMDHPDVFPNWRNDCRNVLTLCLNNTCTNPESNGDVYSGAWATPESSGCCGRCLSAGPLLTGTAWARYAAEADSEWAREIARRQMILVTYDCRDTGVSEDNIDGGIVTNGSWFESAHLAPLQTMLGVVGWMPETFGAARENHVVRSTGVVNHVVYAKGRVAYSTFDAPANTVDILRLAFRPARILADGRELAPADKLDRIGYTVHPLPCGDFVVTVRHDGATRLLVEGDDPQKVDDDRQLATKGVWTEAAGANDHLGTVRVSSDKSAEAVLSFTGNQVRVIGRADPAGGLADVYLDGVKQLAGIDCWSPLPLYQQVLYTKNGLPNVRHEVRIGVRGEGVPASNGSNVYLDAVQYSDAVGENGFGTGGGPRGHQRLIFGYAGRQDYVDSQGNAWRPGCEFVIRSGRKLDAVSASWWTQRIAGDIAGTPDPELYGYGIHGHEFAINLTVGPGEYHLRLKFAAARDLAAAAGPITILVTGKIVAERMDVAATAGGRDRAVDLVVNHVTPQNGIVELRLRGGNVDPQGQPASEAYIQALELGPGDGGTGTIPVPAK
ncbi:MAG: hypothetical protein HY718_13770 [Planctomycetes bacterium]|nr:hypothetical protein [Planctomycetota bacterium]